MSQNRESPKTLKAINKFWINELDTNPEKWVDKLGDSSFENIIESDGRCCYACGRETSSLHRCHITPHALGGSQDHSNIFLLCGRCHQDNPDTAFPELFFNYIKNKKFWLDEIAVEFSKVFTRLLSSDEELGEKVVAKLLDPDFNFTKFLEEEETSKSMSLGCNCRMSYETMAGGIYYTLKESIESHELSS